MTNVGWAAIALIFGPVAVTALLLLLAALALFPVVGVSFFPKAGKTQFIINVDTPKGTSLDKTDAIARQVEAILAADAPAATFATNVGRGNPMIYYNIPPKHKQPTTPGFMWRPGWMIFPNFTPWWTTCAASLRKFPVPKSR